MWQIYSMLLSFCFSKETIIGTWQERGSATFWNILGRMPLPSQNIMCWKAMMVFHKILREGHPNVSQFTNNFPKILLNNHLRSELWLITHHGAGGYWKFYYSFLSFFLQHSVAFYCSVLSKWHLALFFERIHFDVMYVFWFIEKCSVVYSIALLYTKKTCLFISASLIPDLPLIRRSMIACTASLDVTGFRQSLNS